MIKSVFAATAALSMSAGAALAGPYVNVETNAGWTGADYTGATTDLHVGYEGALGENGSYYVQGGASLVSPDGAILTPFLQVRLVSVSLCPTPWVPMVKSPSSVLAMTTSIVDMALSWV
jgi:hypothetical protein